MTDAERAIVLALGRVWDDYLLLPVEHPNDREEFLRAIHAAQEKVLARPARRQLNSV